MSIFNFREGTNRKTKAYIVNILDVKLFISYETVIAVQYGEIKVRQANHWGPTTGRHFNEMGCDHFNVIDDEEEFATETNRLLNMSFGSTFTTEDLRRELANRAKETLLRAVS